MTYESIITLVDLEAISTVLSGLGYFGALLSGFLGTVTVFVAFFPSFLIIPLLATQLNPILVGILGGIGAGFGQYLHYYIGVGGRKIISSKRKNQVSSWRSRLDRYGVVLIFLFAATPLTPDDLIWIPLGVMNYPKLKALAAGILGKITLYLMYSFTGWFGLDPIL